MDLTLALRDAQYPPLPANRRGQKFSNLSIAFICLAFAFVVARLVTRHFMKRKPGWDDWMIILSMVLAIGLTAAFNGAVKNGLALSTHEVDPKHVMITFKYMYAQQLLYKAASCFTKISILFFYLRIFQTRTFKILTYSVGLTTVGYSLGTMVASILQCQPIARSWNKAIPGKCLPVTSLWLSTNVLAIITDLAIILLPVYQLRRLQLPLFQKIGLFVLFGLGFFVVACTLVRIIALAPAMTAKDTLYSQATSSSWLFIEIDVGIICACLPVLKAAVTMVFPSMRSQNASHPSQFTETFPRKGAMTKHIFSTNNPHTQLHNASDEEFILHDVSAVKKTTDIAITYEEPSKKIVKIQKPK
ncbi:uncharacterized protein BP5553_01409 [Venustampulla echinocandica]|uniref:Rhodopsin domain-containing protein n=1 Tax=Venustampulla echinocandica TaxID=2656787 RepID=A0A370U0W6_9HELO|nr:uncharacterized protein BP5553_01409 [Venustampulla echinocandica]RDL41430.1 hypothetical protein BP5553_01409 [Venustampulla echinocandica]